MLKPHHEDSTSILDLRELEPITIEVKDLGLVVDILKQQSANGKCCSDELASLNTLTHLSLAIDDDDIGFGISSRD
ncbi:hypothetical protein CVT25_003523 [Psilocybe cyanescens]|uniref:Uncharacterized protein n=1 Tax=Psilocybe cyanescens TaxID=93625 RepID=A0A409XR01_PSICY|nr:hypothetical protein CVT25_003523 [Psilocybe cyanescens]